MTIPTPTPSTTRTAGKLALHHTVKIGVSLTTAMTSVLVLLPALGVHLTEAQAAAASVLAYQLLVVLLQLSGYSVTDTSAPMGSSVNQTTTPAAN